MKASAIKQPLIICLAAIATPGISCFGYYRLENFGAVDSGIAALIVLAYPTVLIATIGLVSALSAVRRRTSRVLLAIFCLAIPIAFLLSMPA